MGSIVVGTAIALMSTLPGIIGGPQRDSIPILALVANTIATSMASASTEEKFLTVVAAIMLTSLLTGIFFFTLGSLKLGGLARFIPYPVVGGFLAGAGWLLGQTSIGMIAGVSVSFSQLPELFAWNIVIRWLPGLCFALLLLVVSRRYSHFLLIPGMIVAATALFYLILLLTGTSVSDARSLGLLLSPFPKEGLWQPLSFEALTHANWLVIARQINQIALFPLIALLGLLLDISGIEIALRQDMDLNRELQVAGIATLASGLVGSVAGDPSIGPTILSYKMGASNRLVGIVGSGMAAVIVFHGASVLSFFPKPILGGLLLFISLGLLVEWVYSPWFKLPKADYFVLIVILLVIATSGFVQGVAVGLVAGIILFVINYSRISVTQHTFSGANYSSYVQRPLNQERLLRQKGEQTYILQLQGFIFFGNANKLLDQIRQRLNDSNKERLRFLVLDFRLVSGLDSSAVLSFVKIKQLAQKQSINLVLTDLSAVHERRLRQGGALAPNDTIFQVFPDLDRGVEWCENQILEASQWRRQRFVPLAMQLKNLFANTEEVSTFVKYLEKVQLSEGEYLFRQGDNPQALYFVKSGRVSTFVEVDGSPTRRLQTLGTGTMVGEIAFYTKSPHQTCAIADQPSKLYRLEVNQLHLMQQENPKAAAAFNDFALSLLAERLSQAHREIEDLLN